MATSFEPDQFIAHLPEEPGVYRMFNDARKIIYVGKAKNLKKRLSSYFQKGAHDTKTLQLVQQIAHIEFTVTRTELEAFILEHTLIKEHLPRYNVIFKDDKTYPYLHLSKHPYPRLSIRRVKHKEDQKDGEYFGPYPSSRSAYIALEVLYKIFQLRSCEDTTFAHRSRPCLQYQIKRCSAPCVAYIKPLEYKTQLDRLRLFLQGKNQDLLKQISQEMERASNDLQFEKAAELRDQLQALQQVQEQQIAETSSGISADLIAVSVLNGLACVQMLMVRQGNILSSETFFPKSQPEPEPAEILAAFIAQFYQHPKWPPPEELLMNIKPPEFELIVGYLKNKGFKRVASAQNTRGHRKEWLYLAELNANTALAQKLEAEHQCLEQFQSLMIGLELPKLPERIVCFDISHTQGEATVASAVVFGFKGAIKSDYRRFNIQGLTPGDDYGAIAQAVTRYIKLLSEKNKPMPDLFLIDGGQGQLSAAKVILERDLYPMPMLFGISKGPTRKAGWEKIWGLTTPEPLNLQEDSKASHLLQQIRDEAHRFAITGHRKKRDQGRLRSVLEDIPNIGPGRRKALLQHFGGWQGLKQASVSELEKVEGISRKLAESLHEYLAKNSR